MACDLTRYLEVFDSVDFPVIDAMIAVICGIGSTNVNSQYWTSLTIVFDYAQREYIKTKRKYNRYTKFGMYFIENAAASDALSSTLWSTVKPEFIPDTP
eukprot:247970_1